MPYCNDFWHIDASKNILSPACLTVFVISKTENQLIRFVIAYLVANRTRKKTAAMRDLTRHHSRPPNSSDLNPVDVPM